MTKKISGILSLEAKHFAGYRIAELELPVSLRTEALFINGIIDRVSISPGGEPVIIDYKTSLHQSRAETGDEVTLTEFQMPLYIKLYEEKSGAVRVNGAFFYGINGGEIKTVMGKKEGGREKKPDREEYEPFLEAAERQIEEFGKRVRALDFVPQEIRFRNCFDCIYRSVCRSMYSC
jgi:RecB family exonuclease